MLGGSSPVAGDCNDQDFSILFANEQCDGIDNCDGVIDEGVAQTFY